MPEVFTGLQQKLSGFWGGLEKSQKYRIYIISAVLLVAITASILLVTKANYVPLISNADTKEVGEMAKILDDKKLSYKISDDRTGISIDSKDNNKAQAALVQSGYPKSTGMTFDDAFNKIKINTTESDKKKLWEEYKAKSLSSKLKMLDNVEQADVTLAMPEQSLFITGSEQKKATANVAVKAKEELTPKQVDGIIKMVASSVENLNPKDVTVVDNRGNVLSPDATSADGSSTTQYEMTLKKKKELEKNIRDMFNGQFQNFEDLRVVVNPVLDFNKLKTTSNDLVKPQGMDSGALISKQEVKENLVNGTTAGAPGMDSNPGNANSPTYQFGTNGNGNYTKSDKTENYDYSKVQKEEEKALGTVLSDQTTGAITLLYGNKVKDDTGLTPEFLQTVKQIASSATGIPVKNISVTTLKTIPEEIVQPKMSDNIMKAVESYGLFALLLILALGILIALIPRRARVSKEIAPAFEQVAAADGPRFNIPDPEPELPEIQLEDRSEVKKQIDKFVKQKPDAVAQLLRNWLSDDWD